MDSIGGNRADRRGLERQRNDWMMKMKGDGLRRITSGKWSEGAIFSFLKRFNGCRSPSFFRAAEYAGNRHLFMRRHRVLCIKQSAIGKYNFLSAPAKMLLFR